jgi:hypothetical protein
LATSSEGETAAMQYAMMMPLASVAVLFTQKKRKEPWRGGEVARWAGGRVARRQP